MPKLTGGCLCGAVRYTIDGDAAFAGICHCRNCQRYTGSAFEPVLAFPTAAISQQGKLTTYQDTGDSGKPVFRRFCPTCGSGVLTNAEALPDMTLVLVGTLDDTAAFNPVVEIYCASAQPWVTAGAERQRFPKMPG
jgi:hypothetical protein